MRPRVLLADDHTLVVEGFRTLLADSDFEVVGTVDDGRALLDTAQRLRPEVIVLDISMPGMNGLEAARRLRTLLPETKLIFLTMHTERAYVAEALRLGASGFLSKRSTRKELPLAIHEVLQGRTYVTPLVAEPEPAAELTPRQREVLLLLVEGRATKEVAAVLNISVKTVEFHKYRIMDSLGVRSVAELTRYAIQKGLVAV